MSPGRHFLLALAALATSTATARAQQSEHNGYWRVDAPGDCGGEAEELSSFLAARGALALDPGNVSVARAEDDSWTGTIAIGNDTVRSLRGESCSAVLAAVKVYFELVLLRREDGLIDPPTPAGEGKSLTDDPAAASLRNAEQKLQKERGRQTSTRVQTESRERAWDKRLSTGVNYAVTSAGMPLGSQGLGCLARGEIGRAFLRGRLGYFPASVHSAGDAGIRLSMWTGSAELGARILGPLYIGAGYETGSVRGRAVEVEESISTRATWHALSLGLSAELLRVGDFSAELTAAALVPLTESRFVIEERSERMVAHDLATPGGRLTVDVQWDLWAP